MQFERRRSLSSLSRMNNKLLLVVFLICGLILSSLFIRNGQLLILVMPFLAYLIIGALQAPVEIRLAAHRSMDKPGAVAQEPVKTDISVRNEGHALLNLYLDDSQFPSMTVLDGQTHGRISLAAGESMELNYLFKAERGVYVWKSIQAVASAPFGLFELKKDTPAYGELLVRPASLKLNSLSVRPRHTLHTPGSISIRLSGSSTDFLGIREYRPGDSLRHLNWRLGARHPRRFFTNEYEREEIADFGLILDGRKLTTAQGVEETIFEASIGAAASLAEVLLKQGNRVSLLVFGETMASLFPGYGKRQLHRILRSLARARLGSNLPFGYLEYFPTRLFPSRSVLVMLSALGVQDNETYARLRSFGYDILLISPDPAYCMSQMLPATQVNALARRAARVERVIQLKQLMKLGVSVMDWQVNEPFETILGRM